MLIFMEQHMNTIQIALNEPESSELARRVQQTGQSAESIVGEIVRRNLAPWDPEEWKALVRRTAGAWQSRDDLPDFVAKLRREADARLERIEQ
jgi:hypothetical protein